MHHLAGIDDQLGRANTHLEAECAKADDSAVTRAGRRAGIHDHHCAAAADPQEPAIGGLLHGLVAGCGSRQSLLDNIGRQSSGAVEMRQTPVAMPPHPDKSAHPLDHVGERGSVSAGKACRHANFDKLAQHQNMPVRHAADMTAIRKDSGIEFRHQNVEQCVKPYGVGAHRGLGKGKTAQSPDLVVKAAHPPPVNGKAADLHLDGPGQQALKFLIRRNAIPAEIQRQPCQPVAHDIRPPVGKLPVLIVRYPAGDQFPRLDPRGITALGAKVTQPGEARIFLVITVWHDLPGSQPRASRRIAAPRVLQAGPHQASRCTAQLPSEQPALAKQPFKTRQPHGKDRC